MEEKTKPLNAEIPLSLNRDFDAFCAERGIKKQTATAAAIRLYQSLPADVRELLAIGNVDAVQKWFEDRQQAYGEVTALRAALQESASWRKEFHDALDQKARAKR